VFRYVLPGIDNRVHISKKAPNRPAFSLLTGIVYGKCVPMITSTSEAGKKFVYCLPLTIN
jgi:hypothetical protein